MSLFGLMSCAVASQVFQGILDGAVELDRSIVHGTIVHTLLDVEGLDGLSFVYNRPPVLSKPTLFRALLTTIVMPKSLYQY
jgi:hypothetical protein